MSICLQLAHYLNSLGLLATTWLQLQRLTGGSWTFPVKHKLLHIETKLRSVYRPQSLSLTLNPVLLTEQYLAFVELHQVRSDRLAESHSDG